MRFRLPLTALLSLWVLGTSLPDAGAVESEPLALAAASISNARLAQSLSALPERAKVRIDAVPLDAQSSQSVALNLEKFTVFAPDAVVVLDSGSANERRLAPPAMAHFRGEVEGYPGSSAFWSVDESGYMKGILHIGDQIIVTEQPPGSPSKTSAPTSRPVDKSSDFSGRDFQCSVEQPHTLDFFQQSRPGQSQAAPPVAALTNTVYTARIAIETDYEFSQLFASQTAAAKYIADLFGYTSSTYAKEIKTNLQLGNVYLYSNSSDPWSGTTSSTALAEVKAYWRANRSTVTRTLTHFMSGKVGDGGRAYLGALCSSVSGYGVSMNLEGDFSAANPQMIWDSLVVAHEIGHNFGSPHTHEWDTYHGGSPVDCCYKNQISNSGICAASTGSLPGIGSLTGGTSGTGAGTIMSYCHVLSSGYSNQSFTFGLNHTKGISPARVSTQMRTTVQNAAATAPSCLVAENTPTTYILAVNSSGATGVAISASPTTYAGTSNYSLSNITAGTSLTLTAPATARSALFRTWSGCDTTSGRSCTVTMNAAKNVTANFAMTLAPYTDNGDGTVTDPRTGLTWMRCAMGQTWTGSTCSGTASTYSRTQAVALTGATSFAGKSDWRLPNIRELQTIVDRSTYNPAINTAAFPNMPSNEFWSGSLWAPNTTAVWAVPFDFGISGAYELSSFSFNVRLVRGSQSPSLLGLARPTSDYVNNGDGTASHTASGLIWKRCAEGQSWSGSTCIGSAGNYSWAVAKGLSSTFAGKSDWRLPTQEELLSLVDYTIHSPAINTTLFPNTESKNFWSSSPYAADSASAWPVHFFSGQPYANLQSNGYPVRLVRSGAFTLSVSTSGSGSISSAPAGIACGSTCSATFNSGTSVILTATPASGNRFTGWGGACTGTATTCTLSMTAAKSVTASFIVTTLAPYTDNGDGTVTDPRTGLIWMRCAMGQTWTGSTCSGTASTYSRTQAVALTGATSFAGKSDWRLPNIRELQTIVDRSTYNPAINTAAFPNTPNDLFWSASSWAPDPAYA